MLKQVPFALKNNECLYAHLHLDVTWALGPQQVPREERQGLDSGFRTFFNPAFSLALLSLLVWENNRQKLGQSPP